MEQYEIIREIRHKENKTECDEMLLKYHKALSFISETLVSQSKWHITSDEAIINIREYMQKNM